MPMSTLSTFPKELHNFVVNLPPPPPSITTFSGLLILLVLVSFHLLSASDKGLNGVPELKGYPLLGAAHYYLQDGLTSLAGRLIAVGNNGISFTRVGHKVFVCVHQPELVKEVLGYPDDVASRYCVSFLFSF